ncbi:MAG: SDR family NAD(P)-dependent oxidoreductase [Leptospiraceae bacterium]|nr:SDR family NAD(P)-dependent oxidoreductase [Leptospiraceae bacterium]MCP5495052.1 SDR family NAD(P)-dependent oxidoreductase [Leptospiraceae bacterium]
MSEIKNKKILITGATGGLGVEMVKAFLNEGGELILSDLNEDSLKKIELAYKDYGSGKILGTISSDLSSEDGCENLVKESGSFTNCPDILVNNAGIAVIGPFVSIPQEKWEKILQINLLAPMRLTYKFLPAFLERNSGHIVNVSSVAGLIAVPNLATYSVSKFGIKAFGEALEQEVSGTSIRVTNVYPFFTRTPILQSEQIGVSKEMNVPDYLLSKPEDVIRDLIKGLKNNEVHVHPGGISKLIDVVNRFLPRVFQTLSGVLIGK